MASEKHGQESVESQSESINGPRSACYFLSVEVENVRCFKDAQKLILADPEGRPKRWTVLLGDNGVGKTTLLQVLASFQSKQFTMSIAEEQTKNILLPRLYVGARQNSSARPPG
jgi:ABC-type Mn2+/Zn2+ transport system ATPase subunit